MVETLVATQGDENWVLSPDGAYIYVAGNDGYLRVFDAVTGEALHSVDLGSDLGAISLSPDGTRLYFSSQRGRSGFAAGTDGYTFEVTGPFRGAA